MVVLFVVTQEVFGWVREEVRRYHENSMRTLSRCPSQKALQLVWRDALFVMLAFDKPSLQVLVAVDVLPLQLSNYVAPSVGWARFEACALAPIDVNESKFVEELKAELFELGLVDTL